MATESKSDSDIKLDENGYVPSAQEWDETLSRHLARQDGIGELGDEHWRVIRSLRQHFIDHGALPPMRVVCEQSELGPHCVEQLFHGAKEAWRIAGLPDPGEEARAYWD